MRINPEDIHPHAWKAIDEYEHTIAYRSADPKVAEVIARHQAEWWRTYGKSFLGWTVFWTAAFIGGLVVAKQTNLDFLPGVAVLGGLGTGLVGYLRNRRSVTPDELSALLPVLSLDETGRLYLETLSAAYKQDLPAEALRQTVSQLKELMSESVKLADWQRSLRETIDLADDAEVSQDVNDLRARLEATKDQQARETLEATLAMAQQRAVAVERYLPFLERIEAQQALVRETLLRMKSDLMRAKVAPSALLSMEIEGLRQSTLQIRSHADEIERAVLELRGSA